MPPEPLPWDRKDFFRDRKHGHERSDPLGGGGGPVARWRDSSLSASSSSSSYGGSRSTNDFSPRWGFPSDFRRPPGHGKQGGWHMYPEDGPHGYPTSRYGDRFVDDDGFRPSAPRGDGRYGRVYRENRTSFGQREWRSHSWEANHHQSGPRNALGRPHCMNNQKSPHCVNDQKSPHCVNDQKSPHCTNDQKSPHCTNDQKSPHCTNKQKSPHCTNKQKSPHCTNEQKSPHCTNKPKSPHCTNEQKSVGDSPVLASHPHSDPGDESNCKDQAVKTSDVSGPGTGQKVDKENALGILDWKPVKWSRSGGLTSRCSGFSHSSNAKSVAAESNDVKGDLPPKKVTPVQSPSSDAVTCAPSITPEDTTSRKKPRLGWGMGLAKYERQKVDGPEENTSKPGNLEPTHSFTSNLVEKSPRIAGFSDCSSPATPSSVACSSSQGLEDKAYGRTPDADENPNNFSVSSMPPVPENQREGLHFILEKLELKSITNLSSLISELLQADEQCSMDSGFMRSSTLNKLLLWKDDISKSLEMTETEIDSLENELKSLKFDCGSSSPCLAPLNSMSADCKDEPHEDINVIQRPPPLEVVSSRDMVTRETLPCDDARGSHMKNKDEDVDSPGSATSKFIEPLSIQKQLVADVGKQGSEMGLVESTKSVMRNFVGLVDAEKTLETSCQGDDGKMIHDDRVPSTIGNLNLCDQKVDSICDSILAYNKDSAARASEILDKLLPSGNYSFGTMEANRGSTLPAEPTITEKFLRKKRLVRFKERVLSLKYRAFHHLWKEDLRLMSLKYHRTKPQKKFDLSTRTTQNGIQKHRSSIRSRFTSPAGSLSLVPTTEIVNFTSRMLSDSQLKIYRNSLKMPAMILDEKEKSVTRFVSNNGLVEDPCALEKERALINPWTNEEKEIFMDKLATLGKDFGKIASFLDHKTTADCVEFYYKNHKSECFEKTKKKQGKPLSTSTYLVTSGKKWSREREMNAASLDILGAASVIAAQAEEANESSKSISGKSRNRKSGGSDGIYEASSSYCFAEDERETAAADVLASICGSLSSEAMSSCITSSVDPAEGNHDLKRQKLGSSGRRPLTPEVTQEVDNNDDAYSDESCGEMDPVDWTDDEKSLFVQAFSSYGKEFTMISQVLRTKSRDQCRVFFSKARKCLGLDSIPHGTGIHGSGDANGGGGSDAEDACAVETGSIVCSDKSGSRMDEDLPHVNQDVSKPEGVVTDMNTSEENCSADEGDCKDAGHQEDFLPGDCEGGVSELASDGGVGNVQDDILRGEGHLITQDDPSKVEASIGVIDIERGPIASTNTVDSVAIVGNTNERSVSKLENEPINVSSSSIDLVGTRNRCYQQCTTMGDDSSPPEASGSMVNLSDSSPPEASGSMVNLSDSSQVVKGFPLDLSLRPEVNGSFPHKVGSEAKVQCFEDTSLSRKCNYEPQPLQDAAIFGLPLLVKNEGPTCSLESEKPCRNVNVKLFGKILSTTEKPARSAQINDKSMHEHNGVLENVPIESYGFWDGTKVQPGYPSLPDSALLLAKYPAAFGNYTISSSSSSKAEQPTLTLNPNERNVNGARVFSPRELIPQGPPPFRLDVPEAKRDNFEGIPRIQEGGEVIVGGISDPVAALKLHYARTAQQYGTNGGNGLIREESSWRSKGDVGR